MAVEKRYIEISDVLKGATNTDRKGAICCHLCCMLRTPDICTRQWEYSSEKYISVSAYEFVSSWLFLQNFALCICSSIACHAEMSCIQDSCGRERDSTNYRIQTEYRHTVVVFLQSFLSWLHFVRKYLLAVSYISGRARFLPQYPPESYFAANEGMPLVKCVKRFKEELHMSY
jgi:hypothetical protein